MPDRPMIEATAPGPLDLRTVAELARDLRRKAVDESDSQDLEGDADVSDPSGQGRPRPDLGE